MGGKLEKDMFESKEMLWVVGWLVLVRNSGDWNLGGDESGVKCYLIGGKRFNLIGNMVIVIREIT